MSTYQFDKQLSVGEHGEGRLDAFFAQWFVIRVATRQEQRRGIDRIFTRHADGRVYAIEYKTDHTAGKTGNAFVETVSVDTANKPGWASRSEADLLIYYVPEDRLIYVIDFSHLRAHLPVWKKRYPQRSIPNQGYHTHGILVPLKEFEQIAIQVLSA